jgi:hypothetical protein
MMASRALDKMLFSRSSLVRSACSARLRSNSARARAAKIIRSAMPLNSLISG